ncbi:MAG: glutathione S-transferase [Hyphomicrobiaceae bacterium]
MPAGAEANLCDGAGEFQRPVCASRGRAGFAVPTRAGHRQWMQYLDVAQARSRSGVRLALSKGVPGPWGESAKAILHVKGVEYAPVAQLPTLPNEDLLEWTGHANAPVLVVDQEPARAGWADILFAAERLSPIPSLLPDSATDRASMLGLSHEICGEDGFGWNRRHTMVHDGLSLMADTPADVRAPLEVLAQRYGYSPQAGERAPQRAADVLDALSGRLAQAHAAGGHYFFGDRLSALDLYWACFAALVKPLPDKDCPMPNGLRALYEGAGDVVMKALTSELLAHRDFIYQEHLVLPVDF